MNKHDWIIDACEELELYAKKHQLHYLVAPLEEAVRNAKIEAILTLGTRAEHRANNVVSIDGHREVHRV